MGEQPAAFPTLSKAHIDACRTSSWYHTFEDLTIPSRVINLADLGEDVAFREWLDGESIFLPEASHLLEDPPAERPPSPAASAHSQSSEQAPVYNLPKLNAAIRSATKAFGGAVFPKLNWTAPRDAAFIIPQTEGGPLYCKSPADVYLLLKSSDLVSHGIDPERAYASGSEDLAPVSIVDGGQIPIEIVLKKYVDLNPSREFRCFVRYNSLIAVSQRDSNFYDFLQSDQTRSKIQACIHEFWDDEVRLNFDGGKSYVFDVHLSATWDKVTLIDFNPYRSSTDPLLFTYLELGALYSTRAPDAADNISQDIDMSDQYLPVLRVVESASHPEANRTVPIYADNMMPLEVMAMSEGRNMGEFKAEWDEAVARGMNDVSEEED